MSARSRRPWAIARAIALGLALVAALSPDTPPPAGADRGSIVSQAVRDRVQGEGRARVLVELRLPAGAFRSEGRMASAAAVALQRRDIADAQARVIARLQPTPHRVLHRYQTAPLIALDVGPAALAELEASPFEVSRVLEDTILEPTLFDSVPLLEADLAWGAGYDGTGTVIAVLDTGVDAAHPFLAGKVVEEACYSSTVQGVSTSVCPNGAEEQTGAGAAIPCALDGCFHGTHVAGIAAGDGAPASVPFSGVAKGAGIMAVQVFSRIDNFVSCGGFPPCLGAFTSDVLAGLERVYALRDQHAFAAVNLSLGAGRFTAACDGEPFKPFVDNLRSAGIATVAASGNDGATDAISSPACVSSAVSVGASTKSDTVASFSNVASFLSLLAPGELIYSSMPGGGFTFLSGTSMATPHAAGAWAVLRQAAPAPTVDEILAALRQTGRPITDTRGGSTVSTPRIQLFQALGTLVPIENPVPSIASLSPTRALAGGPAFTLTVDGSGFVTGSVVRWNGVDRPTTYVSTTQLQAAIAASDIAIVGTAQVSVFSPTPGGGTSGSLPFTIAVPPALSVDKTTVAPGASVTVTLTNGLGGSLDWLALAAVGAPDTNYIQWTYVGAGVSTRTWTVTMPTTPGAYEFRLFLNGGYTRVATSPTVTADASANPVPGIASLSPTRALAGGPAFTLTVSGSGYVIGSVVRWNGADRPTTYVSTTQLQAAIPAGDIAIVGTAQVSVFSPTPGGGTSGSLPFTIATAPALSVDKTTVQPGASVTMTLTNGLGGSLDWLALAAVSAPNTSYLQWTWVGGGVTTRTWTVTMPATPGAYEFRLFLNNGYTRAATSPTVTVEAGANPVPSIASLSPTSALAGGPAFTLTVNGSGFVASSVVRWNGADRPTTFVSATQLQAAIPAGDIAAAGTAQVSVFSPAPGGGASGSLTFTIATAPALSVDKTTVVPGASVTTTLTNGLGGSQDWLALAAVGSPNTSYLQWTYVGAGVSTRTWTVTMPATPGAYEFRLFLNNGYTRAATSPTVTVESVGNPVPVLSALSPSRADVGGPAFTLTVSGSGYVTGSVVRWNGVDRPTTYVSPTQLHAAISAGDIAAAGTAQVRVFSPAPGGGTSGSLPFTIAVPPALGVDKTTVQPGASVTTTLTNGPGGSQDWLALAAVGAPNTSYLQWTYVGAGVSTRTWTVTMPATPGAYEFRLFLSGGYTRLATSPTVTVSSDLNPVPALSTLSPTSALAGGPAFTLTVSGSGYVTSSVVRWNGADRPTTYVSATQLQAAIPASDIAVVGTAQVSVFSPAPGGGTSGSLSFTITTAPVLSASATTVAPGASVTVTLTNGLGGSLDWLALAAVGAPNTSYLQWTWVGAGATTRTWTVTMPATAGAYEFRLFLNNGYTRAATSPTVTVAP